MLERIKKKLNESNYSGLSVTSVLLNMAILGAITYFMYKYFWDKGNPYKIATGVFGLLTVVQLRKLM